MTLPAHISPVILSASINQIAPLFMQGTGCDEPASRGALTALLADYKPATNEEFTLAADIVHYRFLAMDNLARSAERDLALTKVLHLHGGAVSLSREAHKTQRKLDKLQFGRAIAKPHPEPLVAENQPAPPEAAQPEAMPNQPTPAELAALNTARDILKGIKPGNQSGHHYAQQLRKRIMTQTIAQNSARCAAEANRRAADKIAEATPPATNDK